MLFFQSLIFILSSNLTRQDFLVLKATFLLFFFLKGTSEVIN